MRTRRSEDGEGSGAYPLASEGAGDDEGDVDAVAAHHQAVHAFPETHLRRRRRRARGTVEVGHATTGGAVPFL